MEPLPDFPYHPNPLLSGSVIASAEVCACCGRSRGAICTVAPYAEDLDQEQCRCCPWCVADGSASRKWDAVFVDSDSIAGEVAESVIEEITSRTPGFASWQQGEWPVCCGDGTAFLFPAGIEEIRKGYRELEGPLLSHIIYNMGISGGAATRLLGSLNREKGPTAYIFQCRACSQHHFHLDRP